MYPREMSIEKTKTAAESGDPKAAFHLGWRYYIGNGLARDKTEAWKWYSMAASQGVREAAEIRAILEAEAQRDLELAVLRETIPSSRKRSTVWLLLICAILTSIGSVAVVFHVLDGQPDTGKPGAAEDAKITKVSAALRAVNQSPGTAEKQANLGQVEAGPEDLKTVSVAGLGRGGISTEHGTSEPVVAAGSRTPVSQPTDPKRSSGSLTDFNAVAERAMKWRDGDDAPGTNEPVKGTDQKRGQE
jgi:hypothetical protein